jgi:hypothetical protein
VAFAVDQREHDHVTAPNVSKSSWWYSVNFLH